MANWLPENIKRELKKKQLQNKAEAYPKLFTIIFQLRKSFWWMKRVKIHIEFNFHNSMLLQLFGELYNLPTKLAFYTYKEKSKWISLL